MTGHDERNPLARALDEVSGGSEARAFTISVEAVRAGARRRRARRTGVTSGLAVLVVGAVAGGAYAGLPGWGGRQDAITHPGAQGTSEASPVVDWPAQFLRCGKVVGDALPHLGGDVPLTVSDASSAIPADGPWSASVTVDVPAAPAGSSAVVWGTDLSVVKDGIVVGVQEGPVTPDLSWSLSERLGGGELPTSPFPVTTQVTRTLASCDQYPSGQGSPYLAPGSYALVVTQTLSYATAPGANPTLVDVRSSVTTSVTITAPLAGAGPSGLGVTLPETTPPRPSSATPGSASSDSATPGSASSGSATTAGLADLAAHTDCGAPADDLAALVDAPGAPYTAALNPHPTPYGYANIPASPVLTPVPGRTVAHDLVDVADPVVVAIQGGTVVARSVVPNHPDAWTGALTITFPDPPALIRCPGVPAPTDGGPGLPGDYVLRLVVDVTVTGAEPGTWLIASAPLP